MYIYVAKAYVNTVKVKWKVDIIVYTQCRYKTMLCPLANLNLSMVTYGLHRRNNTVISNTFVLLSYYFAS